jgi:hypothetical protein
MHAILLTLLGIIFIGWVIDLFTHNYERPEKIEEDFNSLMENQLRKETEETDINSEAKTETPINPIKKYKSFKFSKN